MSKLIDLAKAKGYEGQVIITPLGSIVDLRKYNKLIYEVNRIKGVNDIICPMVNVSDTTLPMRVIYFDDWKKWARILNDDEIRSWEEQLKCIKNTEAMLNAKKIELTDFINGLRSLIKPE